MKEGEARRDGPSDGGTASPLHNVAENNRDHSCHHDNAIRKPPPTAEQQSNNGRTIKARNENENSVSNSGGESDKSNASLFSIQSKTGSSNSGASSELHIVTGTGNSNSDSSDRGSSTRGGTDGRNDIHSNHDTNILNHGICRMEGNVQCSNKTQDDNTNVIPAHSSEKFYDQNLTSIQKSKDETNVQVAASINANNNKCSSQKNAAKKSPSENGSDGGYAASASSNDVFDNNSSTSDSVSSSEGGCHRTKSTRFEKRSVTYESSSSEIADFSSGVSDNSDDKVAASATLHSTRDYLLNDSSSDDSEGDNQSKRKLHSNNTTSTSTKTEGNGAAVSAYKRPSSSVTVPASKRRRRHSKNGNNNSEKVVGTKTTGLSPEATTTYKIPKSWDFIKRSLVDMHRKLTEQQNYSDLKQNYDYAMKRYNRAESSSGLPSSHELSTNISREHSSTTPLYNVGVDVMANILSYLKPSEAHRVLSEPLSKTYRETFSMPQYVWKIMCLSEPFYATVDKKSDDDSSDSYPICNGFGVRHVVGKYRLLFSTFVRCMNYLDRIKYDAIHGRLQTNDENFKEQNKFKGNSSLEHFFAMARDVVRSESDSDISSSSLSSEGKVNENEERKSNEKGSNFTKTAVKYGSSTLTKKLLGPVHSAGIAGDMNLPSSCAVFSIVNWMVAFADVAGIQTMCMQVFTILLEDDKQRITAQHAGLTDIVLRAMVLFPNNADLHTNAFHTLVLLARPIGGKEGQIFYKAMVNASGIFNIGSSTGKSGIAIMMDSMKRFSSNERLQAMSCWSMVNIALMQSQKVALVRLGGISAAGNAMMQHPTSADVQFRALFALINLVIPHENMSPENSLETDEAIRQQLDGVNIHSETEMLEESVESIANLVVTAMKNFCSNSAILNRACLVLHNLSLNAKFHNVLLWTPNCYQMIEWCIENYKQDKVLQQSARGTLNRLQMTLSNDETLRLRFTETIRAQQQGVVESGVIQTMPRQTTGEEQSHR